MLGRSVISLMVLCMILLTGCSTILSCDDGREVVWFTSSTEHLFNNGIRSYEDGNYSDAMKIFQDVVDNQDSTKEIKVESYKYLAFIHCISDREKMCRESFKKALDLNPDFSLTPAEAGHPVWGSVFNTMKSKTAK
jgi:outer membrane protein assembly factor BamD (BamD/ComL family)